MPSPKVTHQDEADFMRSLLSGLDSAHATSAPITPSKFKKPQKVERVLQKMKSPKFKTSIKIEDQGYLPTVKAPQDQEDLSALLEGADDWDWSDMTDFLTPKKAPVPSPQKSKPAPGPKLGSPRNTLPQVPQREYQKDSCTRCIIESVSNVNTRGRPQKVSLQLPFSKQSVLCMLCFLDAGGQNKSRRREAHCDTPRRLDNDRRSDWYVRMAARLR
jgi:DNA replication ATP-dependent helicase Dna2